MGKPPTDDGTPNGARRIRDWYRRRVTNLCMRRDHMRLGDKCWVDAEDAMEQHLTLRDRWDSIYVARRAGLTAGPGYIII